MAPRKKMKPAESALTISKEGEQEDTEPLQAVVTGVKRGKGRPARAQQKENLVKRKKLDFRQQRGWGQVLTVGQGDTGQLGLGEDVMEKSRPAAVSQISAAVDAVAGGMHINVKSLFVITNSSIVETLFLLGD